MCNPKWELDASFWPFLADFLLYPLIFSNNIMKSWLNGAEEIVACIPAFTLFCFHFVMQVWKGYSQRRKTKKMREEELIFVGMVSYKLTVYFWDWLLYTCWKAKNNYFKELYSVIMWLSYMSAVFFFFLVCSSRSWLERHSNVFIQQNRGIWLFIIFIKGRDP